MAGHKGLQSASKWERTMNSTYASKLKVVKHSRVLLTKLRTYCQFVFYVEVCMYGVVGEVKASVLGQRLVFFRSKREEVIVLSVALCE